VSGVRAGRPGGATRTGRTARAGAAAALVLAAALAGCGGPGAPDPHPDPDADPTTAEETDVAFTNPVHDGNLPDPFVLRAEGAWWAYGTQGRLGTLPVLRSHDLVHWEVVGDGMPVLAPWSGAGRHWAPEVVELGGRYVAYYTAMERGTQQQCLGVAYADHPAGPFVDGSGTPFVCEHEEGGSIDASPFVDVDGTPYLLWKNDGNHVGVRSWIRVQQLSPDGSALVGDGPVDLITHDQPWEGTSSRVPPWWRATGGTTCCTPPTTTGPRTTASAGRSPTRSPGRGPSRGTSRSCARRPRRPDPGTGAW